MRSSGDRRVRDLLDRRVQIVAGKGGVGRTLIASALAIRASEGGHRTLLLEVDAPDSAASLLGVAPAIDVPREVHNNLWLCRMTPAGSLREYALMVLKFRALYNLVFENRLVKYLLRSTPSLAEFTMLGKAWYHTTETLPGGEPRFQRVVVDAPATGHAMTFLSVARTVADIAPEGIMREAAGKMADMVESKESTCLHIACIPEEMPVNEALDILAMARSRLRMTPGLGVVNRVLPPLCRGARDEAVLSRLLDRAATDPALLPYAESARRRRDREIWQSEHVERFRERSRLPIVLVPEIRGARVNRDLVHRVVELFAEAAGEDAPLARASDG